MGFPKVDLEPDMVVRACNLHTHDSKAGGVRSRPD